MFASSAFGQDFKSDLALVKAEALHEEEQEEKKGSFFKGILKNPKSEAGIAIKDITYIPGRLKDKVVVFEGFMDFLTALTIKNQPILSANVMVLNMVNLREAAIDFIKEANYEMIYTFFDNDSAGEKTTSIFVNELSPKCKIEPQNHLYKGFKDYNDHLCNHLKGKGVA